MLLGLESKADLDLLRNLFIHNSVDCSYGISQCTTNKYHKLFNKQAVFPILDHELSISIHRPKPGSLRYVCSVRLFLATAITDSLTKNWWTFKTLWSREEKVHRTPSTFVVHESAISTAHGSKDAWNRSNACGGLCCAEYVLRSSTRRVYLNVSDAACWAYSWCLVRSKWMRLLVIVVEFVVKKSLPNRWQTKL